MSDLPSIPYHTHNRLDSPPIDADSITFSITSVAPTDTAPNGTIRLYFSGTTYKIYARINNTWRSATLT